MKVLFVSSGNKQNGVSAITQNQGNSLIKLGLDITFFTIKGEGTVGYLRNIFILKKILKKNNFDIVHAHYSYSGMVASLAGAKPIVVSLMGSDVESTFIIKYLIKLFALFSWKSVIIKSRSMKEKCGIRKAIIVPNGVDFTMFKPKAKSESLSTVKWDSSKKHILFAADPERKEKNFKLFKDSYDLICDENIEWHPMLDISNALTPEYYNSADVVILSSLHEGSPNVIKEAMACNRPIVSTDVGDVNEVIGKTKGCYVSKFNPLDFSQKIKLALEFAGPTNGREDVKHLESYKVANRINNIYNNILA